MLRIELERDSTSERTKAATKASIIISCRRLFISVHQMWFGNLVSNMLESVLDCYFDQNVDGGYTELQEAPK